MNDIDLSKASPEQIEKIKEILNQEKTEESSNKIREEYLTGLKNIKVQRSIPGIELDGNLSGFEHDLIKLKSNPSDLSLRRQRGLLTRDERETYRQLEIIHKDGVENFWGRVKNVVESRKDIRKEDISDNVNIKELLNE